MEFGERVSIFCFAKLPREVKSLSREKFVLGPPVRNGEAIV